MKSLKIKNKNGCKFVAIFVDVGDNYGLNFCLLNSGEPLVEFYDVNNSNRARQMISSYNVSTILEDDYPRGLCLDGGNADVWSVDSDGMVQVKIFLEDCLKGKR